MATPGNLGTSVLASKTKTKKKHFVAQKVKLFRASDPLLSVLMWGVNHSVRLLCGALLLLLGFSLTALLLLLQRWQGGDLWPDGLAGPGPSGCSPLWVPLAPRRASAPWVPLVPLAPPLEPREGVG